MKHLILGAAIALLLSACGGGGSSSNSSDSGTRYTGTQNITFSASRFNQPVSSRFIMTVDGNSVFITDEGNPAVTASGTLNGNQFTATGNSSGTLDNITCTFRLTYTGTISGNQAQGSVRGTAPCSDNSLSVTFNASGSFSATTGSGKVLIAEGIMPSIVEIMK